MTFVVFFRPALWRRAFSLCAVVGVLLSLSDRSIADTAQYFYDPAGRLTAMLDPVNGSAQYNYDKSGNITSIVRNPLATITVLQITQGPVAIGSNVTIAGTAFGNTTNTSVSFNGTVATPSSVTSTSLAVLVPTGATTGSVSVTSPAGTATYPIPLAIGLPAAPTISSFTTGTGTPTISPIGGALTISGANYDTLNSKVLVNGQFAQVTSASSTSLSVLVPQSSSNKVEIRTPAGAILSSSDLIVAPQGFAASTVSSGRTTVGASAITVAKGGVGTVSLALFDVTASQKLLPRLSSLSGCPVVTLLYPNGFPDTPGASQCGSNYYYGPFVARVNGTYSVEVAPTSSGAATFQAQVYLVPPDPTGTVTIGGSATPMTFSPGQNGSIAFSGTAGQRVIFNFDQSGMSGACTTYGISNPDKSALISATASCATRLYLGNAALNLPQTGTYTISLMPTLGAAGTIQTKILSVPTDPITSLTIGGGTGSVIYSTPGQHGTFTFSGATGQKIMLNLDFSAMSGTCTKYSVVNPDTSVLIAATTSCGSHIYPGNAPIILPQTGTYTVTLAPDISNGSLSAGVGTTSGTVFTVPADATATATVGGSEVSVSITTPGQQAHFFFAGTSGAHYTSVVDLLHMTPCSKISVLNPDNSTLVNPTSSCGSSFSTGSKLVSQTGTFTIIVVPDVSSGALTSGTGTTGATVTSP